MDDETRYKPDSGRTASPTAREQADSANPVMQIYLYAMPGALDLVVCDEIAEQESNAA